MMPLEQGWPYFIVRGPNLQEKYNNGLQKIWGLFFEIEVKT
jgi:hypothetical protein